MATTFTLTCRYANRSSLLAIELLNEPLAPGVALPGLKQYYQDGYDAVRRYTPTAYVVISNRLGIADPTELLQFAGGLSGSVLDVHYYNLFESKFANLTVQQNIEYVRNNRSSDLAAVTSKNNGFPLTFVGKRSDDQEFEMSRPITILLSIFFFFLTNYLITGEWVAEWNLRGASKEDYQKFAQVQEDVYGRATFGWAYWTLKNVNQAWSLEWMINNGYISLTS
jgi:hypothetical protein